MPLRTYAEVCRLGDLMLFENDIQLAADYVLRAIGGELLPFAENLLLPPERLNDCNADPLAIIRSDRG